MGERLRVIYTAIQPKVKYFYVASKAGKHYLVPEAIQR
jgi:hypothetical protein